MILLTGVSKWYQVMILLCSFTMVFFIVYEAFVHSSASNFRLFVKQIPGYTVLDAVANISRQSSENDGRISHPDESVKNITQRIFCQSASSKTLTVPYVRVEDLSIGFRETGRVPYRNILGMAPPPYLDNFKNPCWREELQPDNIYKRENTLAGMMFMSRRYNKYGRTFKKRIKGGISWRLRCLPYFHLAGFVKCGTTELFHNIRNHPMIPNSNQKETHFWNRHRNHLPRDENKTYPIHDYVDAFDRAALDVEKCTLPDGRWSDGYYPQILGDGTPKAVSLQWSWWLHPENEGRTFKDGPRFMNAHYIKHLTPNARIIITMRNPADRLYSFYRMKRGKSPAGFHKGVVRGLDMMRGCLQTRSAWSCVTDPNMEIIEKHMQIIIGESLYYPHLVKWLDVFPRSQIHFVKLEEFSQDRIAGLNQIYKFLGLEELAASYLNKEPKNVRLGCPNCTAQPMMNTTRQLLQDFYRPYNQLTAQLLNDTKWNFQ